MTHLKADASKGEIRAALVALAPGESFTIEDREPGYGAWTVTRYISLTQGFELRPGQAPDATYDEGRPLGAIDVDEALDLLTEGD